MPGKKMRSIKGGKKGNRMYEKLRSKGHSKSSAARITNAQHGKKSKTSSGKKKSKKKKSNKRKRR